jgi:hypothetical protein
MSIDKLVCLPLHSCTSHLWSSLGFQPLAWSNMVEKVRQTHQLIKGQYQLAKCFILQAHRWYQSLYQRLLPKLAIWNRHYNTFSPIIYMLTSKLVRLTLVNISTPQFMLWPKSSQCYKLFNAVMYGFLK